MTWLEPEDFTGFQIDGVVEEEVKWNHIKLGFFIMLILTWQ
jgi:hypothetical protein